MSPDTASITAGRLGDVAGKKQPPRPRRPVRRLLGQHPIGIAFVTPYTVFLAVLAAYPILLALWISFHDFFFTAPGVDVPKPFVGLDNYADVLSDPLVRRSFVNIAIFLAINVPLTTIAALALAAVLNAVLPLRGFFRTAYYLPYVTASVAVVAVWLWLFSRDGLVNTILGHLAPQPSWLVNETLVMPLIALYVTWKQLGFFVVLYLAALQNIPRQLYESAAVDGAGRLRIWWSITVPSVRPATTLVVVLATIWGANLFTEPYLLTGSGGPNGASMSPVLIMYQKGIQQGKPDFAAALGFVLVAAVLALSLLNRRLLERE
ncbi:MULTISPECIES: carbohydrate ABC transporter permease [Micromonospora]|uniref:Sugar ABC transporter permease n=1 Tax=Micromonospora sicca TaxID=2202420 RepID=A0A317D5Y4_9ACTN|nr:MULTISPECIES: sugar ABC transporter permease [unclassified Micromonospora]MBM0224269.1 sugar ABC transporter permease [Micromonospora sp. ATA51]PWR07995.1 sugar ABC transporter permease [Micromonospora sp. 4G51]